MDKTTILVVDDEAEIRRALRIGLEAEGWIVHEAWDRGSLVHVIDSTAVDLITLDLMLGQQDGLGLAREIRALQNIPIVMLSGKGQPYDRVRGLECGADDYIVKPFHIREVILRLRNVLDRYRLSVTSDRSIVFDHSAFDPKRRVVTHGDGSPIELTALELQLLELFVRHPGRDDISQALHGRDWSPFDRTIDGHVARLRRKVEPAGEAPTLIRSVRGVGYVFTGDVTPPSSLA